MFRHLFFRRFEWYFLKVIYAGNHSQMAATRPDGMVLARIIHEINDTHTSGRNRTGIVRHLVEQYPAAFRVLLSNGFNALSCQH